MNITARHFVLVCGGIAFISTVRIMLVNNQPYEEIVHIDVSKTTDIKQTTVLADPPKKASKLTTLTEGNFPPIKPHLCRRSPILSDGKTKKDFMICAKPLEVDKWVSGSIVTHGIWERDLIEIILQRLRQYPQAAFLDLGANLGMFSIAAAAFGHRVYAVDPINTNLAYLHASQSLSNAKGEITYIHNSVNNASSTLYPWNREPDNEGGITLLTQQQAHHKPENEIGTPIQSVTFEEILEEIPEETIILKVDIEGYECKVLTGYMNQKEKVKFIPFLLMEWEQIGKNRDGFCPNIESLKQGFISSGYTPVDATNLSPVPLTGEFPHDVLWVHSEAKDV